MFFHFTSGSFTNEHSWPRYNLGNKKMDYELSKVIFEIQMNDKGTGIFFCLDIFSWPEMNWNEIQ